VVVAFSGGVDSTYLLKIARDVLGQRVIAVTAVSPLQPKNESTEARTIARHLRVKHITIRTNPLKKNAVRSNLEKRCYHCKLFLLTKLKQIAKKHAYVVIEATNRSDLKDHRPGIKAVRQLGVKSPLIQAGFEKDDIRKSARTQGLPNWNKPSMACLASRIPYGLKITHERLRRIESAEKYLRRLKFSQLRVRDHYPIARIEMDPGEFTKLMANRKRIITYLSKLGYKHITLDLEGYQTGSLNR